MIIYQNKSNHHCIHILCYILYCPLHIWFPLAVSCSNAMQWCHIDFFSSKFFKQTACEGQLDWMEITDCENVIQGNSKKRLHLIFKSYVQYTQDMMMSWPLHNDVMTWQCFLHCGCFVRESTSKGIPFTKGLLCSVLMFSLLLVWTSYWVAINLRCIMLMWCFCDVWWGYPKNMCKWLSSLHWCHNGQDGVSNHQPHDCLLNRLFRCRSKKTSKLCVTGVCAGNSPVTGEIPTQKASNVDVIYHETNR